MNPLHSQPHPPGIPGPAVVGSPGDAATSRRLDVVVVGGGHAGIEAAHAAARIGCRTALVTLDRGAIGRMSCNPAIGGIGKSHLVGEVDALGGLMARATDAAGLQFRTLNTTKGPAVRAVRVQCDKDEYAAWMQQALARVPGLAVVEGEAEELLFGDGGSIEGLRLVGGATLRARAVVLTTGTFLDGLMHFGLTQQTGGRIGERAATRLSQSFAALGIAVGRLKTGTPARIHRDSIDFSKTEPQPGESPIPPMSIRTAAIERVQELCHLTRTNAETHEIIRANLDQSPMYCGVIQGVGPRYCPSIEDKVMRFAEKSSHQVFLEPETRGGISIYPNGVSTSLPPAVQERFLRTVPGLERCELLRPGYAVEYTFVLPHQLRPTLEVREAPGLFLAGQINGTSGYEEAAAQGILAGINAALFVRDEAPLVLRRDEAYIGVMVDDLISKDPREPYRMFTSRAEFRLLLRQDNADLRLADHARRVGMMSELEYTAFCMYREAIRANRERIETTPLRTSALDPGILAELGTPAPEKSVMLGQFLARPEVGFSGLLRLGLAHAPDLRSLPAPPLSPGDGPRPLHQENESSYLAALASRGVERASFQIETEVLYAGYIRQQAEQVARNRRFESVALPDPIDYRAVRGLTREAADRLALHRPATLGQASRLHGVNPADIDVLLVYVRAMAPPAAPAAAPARARDVDSATPAAD